MLCLILLILFFSRRHYWGYGYPFAYNQYSPYNGGYGYGYGTYPYGAYSSYNPYARPPWSRYYGYPRPYGYW